MSTPPETFEAHGHTWTKHTPGDPMPCDTHAKVQVWMRGDDAPYEGNGTPAGAFLWSVLPISAKSAEIVAWRYADKHEPSELDKLREEVEQLRRWKAEQMALESSWDEQAVGKLLVACLWASPSSRRFSRGLKQCCGQSAKLKMPLKTTTTTKIEPNMWGEIRI